MIFQICNADDPRRVKDFSKWEGRGIRVRMPYPNYQTCFDIEKYIGKIGYCEAFVINGVLCARDSFHFDHDSYYYSPPQEACGFESVRLLADSNILGDPDNPECWVNLTPHTVILQRAGKTIRWEGAAKDTRVTNLLEPTPGTIYIVSLPLLLFRLFLHRTPCEGCQFEDPTNK